MIEDEPLRNKLNQLLKKRSKPCTHGTTSIQEFNLEERYQLPISTMHNGKAFTPFQWMKYATPDGGCVGRLVHDPAV